MARGTKLQKHNERNSRQYVRSLYAAEARIAELEAAIRATVETLNHIRGEAISTPPDWSSVDRIATDLRDELAKKV